MQSHHSAFIINRLGSLVFYRLSHIIDVDIVTEDFSSILVFGSNGCSCETNIGSVRQSLSYNPGCADRNITLFVHLLGKPILAAVRLVDHDYNIAAVVKRFITIHEFLHSSENDSIRFATDELIFKVLSA